MQRIIEEFSTPLFILAVLTGFYVAARLYLGLHRALRAKRWRAAAEALGVDFVSGRHSLSLRGEVDGVRVDLVWARRDRGHSRSAPPAIAGLVETAAGAGGRRRSSSHTSQGTMYSGTRLVLKRDMDLLVRPLRGLDGLDKFQRERHGSEATDSAARALERFFSTVPEADVTADRIEAAYRGPETPAALAAIVRDGVAVANTLSRGAEPAPGR